MVMRVQIPAYHDRWMKGDRYGEVLRTFQILLDGKWIERARVKLDRSGVTVTVNHDDCTEVE